MDSRSSSISSYSTDVVSYIQIRVLGKGAHGRAVLYRNATDDSLVVWKEITLEQNTATEVQKEIDILSMLVHPNIVTYYNHFFSCDTIFIEMEYANAGSLAKLLKEKSTDLLESDVRWFFFQIVYGVEYIHKCQIIHRDIKSLNIFMSSSSLIKIGDFGISKVLSENEMAQTRVGTPVYMSPEVIQGYRYSTKSDIWSCGCVLYELLTRKKLVKCSNELGIAMKIVNRDFQNMPKHVDQKLMNLLDQLLEHDPSNRPTATEILKHDAWYHEQHDMITKIRQINQSDNSPRPRSGDQRERSIVSLTTEVFVWGGGKIYPIKLEQFTQNECALQVSVGPSHFAVLTVEKHLYTWSTNQGDSKVKGHLGHGQNVYKKPHIVSCLKGISIKEVSCGAESTACLSCNGEVFTCGSNYYGQLGLGSLTPEMVDVFVPIQVIHPKTSQVISVRNISSGYFHVAAIVSEDDSLFTWGNGEYGRLGLNKEDNALQPTLVDLPTPACKVKLVQCGPDNSFIVLKSNDRLMACGNNKYNKLGINVSATGLIGSSTNVFSYDVPFETSFKMVRFFRDIPIKMISCGKNHTAILDEYDKMYIFGQNKYGQLGLGDVKSHPGINQASKIFAGKQIELISSGDNFTVATTFDNEIYAWGAAENGRLGLDKACGEKYIPNPRPLFGCLYKCADLKSSGWQSIMITERVLETNTITASNNQSLASEVINDAERSTNTVSSNMTPRLCGELNNALIKPPDGSEPRQQQSFEEMSRNDTRTSDLAPWLQAELNEAEYIPIASTMFNRDVSNMGRYKCDCGCHRCRDYIRDLESTIISMETKR